MGYLIFDTETNGLPQCKAYGFFPPYTQTEKYAGARVVQVSYIITNEVYTKLEESDTIIKMDDFKITNSEFHGITEHISETQGITFQEFAKGFSNSLDFVHTIVAHNLNFDFNVICAELYRYGFHDIITKLESKKQICTMKRYKNLVCATFKSGTGSFKGEPSLRFKDPNLKELYTFATGEVMENHHNSMYDVLNLHKAVKLLEMKFNLT
uniref:Exonuclease domain-containing protein n=1 Tax=viral metagenome TaxID=1070528 RepID=A0A6C0B0Q6_9ZZZZ